MFLLIVEIVEEMVEMDYHLQLLVHLYIMQEVVVVEHIQFPLLVVLLIVMEVMEVEAVEEEVHVLEEMEVQGRGEEEEEQPLVRVAQLVTKVEPAVQELLF